MLKTIIVAMLLAFASFPSTTSAQETVQGTFMGYRVQMFRDRITIQCQKLLLGVQRDNCETSTYNSYYSIIDSIRKAERIGDDVLKRMSQQLDAFEAESTPLFQKLEHTVTTIR